VYPSDKFAEREKGRERGREDSRDKSPFFKGNRGVGYSGVSIRGGEGGGTERIAWADPLSTPGNESPATTIARGVLESESDRVSKVKFPHCCLREGTACVRWCFFWGGGYVCSACFIFCVSGLVRTLQDGKDP